MTLVKPYFKNVHNSIELPLGSIFYITHPFVKKTYNCKNIRRKCLLLTMEQFFCQLRWLYTRRIVNEMLQQHSFFCSCTCVKVLFTDTFLKCRFCWKVEMISAFPLRTNVAFFLNQSILFIYVNKVSHYNMALAACFNLKNS